MRFSQALKKYRSEEGKRLARIRWDREQPKRNADADTLRSRALFDRKGKLIVAGIAVYHGTARSDQLDIYVYGVLAVTGGPRVIANWLSQQITA
jgi:hypothetical protein